MGKGSGKKIIEMLKGATKRVIVVSPWIGKKEAALLDEVSRRLNVRVLTLPEGNPALEVLSEDYWYIPTLLAAFIFLVSGIVLSRLYLPLLLVSLFSFPLFLLSRKKRPKKWVKTIKDLHAKLYIIDDVLILSSANFTPSGLKKNIEFVAIVRDKDILEETLEKIDVLMEGRT